LKSFPNQPGRTGHRQTLEEICDELAAAAKAFKKDMCRHCDEPVDVPATMVYRLDGDSELRTRDFPHGHPVETFPAVWASVLKEGKAVVTEAYIGTIRHTENYRRGQLAREFERNPGAGVREGVLITSVDTQQGRHRTTLIPFKYDRRGLPKFTSLPWDDKPRDDRLSGLLAECARQVQRRTGR